MSNQYAVAIGAAVGAGVACYTMLSSIFPEKKKAPFTQTAQVASPPPKVCEVAKPATTVSKTSSSSETNTDTMIGTSPATTTTSAVTMTMTTGDTQSPSPRASDSLLTGVVAAASAAFQLSDVVFVYESGDGNAVLNHVNDSADAGLTNAHGATPSAAFVSTRAGAGRVVLGAAATREASVSVFVPGQSLQLMQPVLKKLAKAKTPVVFHVTAVRIADALTYSTDFSGVFMIRDTGAAIVASYSPQEAYQLALVSHLVANQCNVPVAHVFDAEIVARGSGTVATLDKQQMTNAKALIPAAGNNQNHHQSQQTAADAFQEAFNKLKSHFNASFKLFETPVCRPHAVHVVVIFGGAVGQICAAASEASVDVHVVQVRVYRPWSSKSFIDALPQAVKRLPKSASWSISVATVSARSGVQNALVADVTTTLSSGLWHGPMPTLVKCTFLPESGGFTMTSARAIVDRLVHNSSLDQSMVIGSNVLSSPLSRTPAAPSLAVWGTSSNGVRELVSAVGEKLLVSTDMYHNTIVDDDSFHPAHPVFGRMTLYSDQSAPHFFPESYKTVLVLESELFNTHAHDIASTIGSGSTIYLNSELRGDELLESFPVPIKAAIGKHHATVVSFTLTGSMGLSNAVGVALVGLLDTRCSESIELTKVAVPLNWAALESSDPGSELVLSNKAFNRRLSITTAEPDRSKPESSEMIPEHAVAMNVLFNGGKQAQTAEVLRPHEHEVYQVRCTVNKRLTPAHYDRHVFHLEFDTTGTGLTYNIGDALGVFGQNDADEVAEFIEFYGLKATDFVALPHGGSRELLSVEQLLRQRVDIFGKPSQKFYAALAFYATDTYEAKKLKWMGSEDKEAFKLRQYEAVTFADVLMEFKSAHPSFLDLLQLVPLIKPRHYSIASSNKAHPNSVHLLVVAVDWVTPKGRKRYGQCTRYLAKMDPTQAEPIMVTVDIKPSICKLPDDPKQPVICAGLGTGLAPYRAFVQERAYLKAQGVEIGPMSLYFGARYRSEEYLYGDELDEYYRTGVITDLRLAFSRDQKHKVYIQHLILEDKTKLAEYFRQDGGYFYMCGPTWPVPDVKQAICEGLVSSIEDFTMEDADDYLEELKEHGRYVLEVY